jgi:hypothetical protein
MTKYIAVLTLGAVLVAVSLCTCLAGDAYFSMSGGILAPDATVLSPGVFSANDHLILIHDGNSTTNILGVNLGVLPGLEVGLAHISSNLGGDSQTIVNGKYQVIAETPVRPALMVGVVDATSQMDSDRTPGIYAVIGKDLSLNALEFGEEGVLPLRVYAGFGTGIYNGFFGGVEYGVTPRVSISVEYLNEMRVTRLFSQTSVFDAAVKVQITDALSADIAWIRGSDLGLGVSYTVSAF